jgi:hypothetical protein
VIKIMKNLAVQMYKEWNVNKLNKKNTTSWSGTFKTDLSTEWTMILKFIFCTFNQQMHTTVIRFTITLKKKLLHVSDHTGPSSGSRSIVVVQYSYIFDLFNM